MFSVYTTLLAIWLCQAGSPYRVPQFWICQLSCPSLCLHWNVSYDLQCLPPHALMCAHTHTHTAHTIHYSPQQSLYYPSGFGTVDTSVPMLHCLTYFTRPPGGVHSWWSRGGLKYTQWSSIYGMADTIACVWFTLHVTTCHIRLITSGLYYEQ